MLPPPSLVYSFQRVLPTLLELALLTGVGHRQDAGAGVLQGEVLVLEFGAVDGLAAGSVVVGEVTTLSRTEKT